MRVSGFTIIRNGNIYGYPYKEAILSILPVCDEVIVNVGVSDDDTLESVKEIDDPKIKIFESEWDMSLREGGKVLSIETNKAKEKCSGDWCFYIQADEVVHEKFLPIIKQKMEKYKDKTNVDGLRFYYKHFYGTYDYIQDNYRNWYFREVRVIKNKENIVSWGDAMDFRYPDGSHIKRRDIKAEIYHYGWVRPPKVMTTKKDNFEKLYHKNDHKIEISEDNIYDELGDLVVFKGTHPKVMKERIKNSQWNFDPKIDEQPPDWVRKIKILFHPLIKRFKKLY